MDEEDLKGKACAYATLKSDGTFFWQNGIYKGETDSHFLFEVRGQIIAVLKTSVQKMEFKEVRQ